jgi:hypothetical protein
MKVNKQQLKEKGNVQRVSVRLTRLGSPELTPLLKFGASSESRRNVGSKNVRSIKAKRKKTRMSSSCMNVIRVIDV